jgi:hypothetical protein
VLLWVGSEVQAVEALFLDLKAEPEQSLEHCCQPFLASAFAEVIISVGRTAVLILDAFDLDEWAFVPVG